MLEVTGGPDDVKIWLVFERRRRKPVTRSVFGYFACTSLRRSKCHDSSIKGCEVKTPGQQQHQILSCTAQQTLKIKWEQLDKSALWRAMQLWAEEHIFYKAFQADWWTFIFQRCQQSPAKSHFLWFQKRKYDVRGSQFEWICQMRKNLFNSDLILWSAALTALITVAYAWWNNDINI